MKRRMWLKNVETGEIWDLLPDDPWRIEGGCALLNPDGLGYEQDVSQNQVEVDYFISAISSKNKPVSGDLYFVGDEHLKNFQSFIGDFRRQFLLYYSPDGDYHPLDQLSSPFYKPVTISSVNKTEKDQFGWYVCPVSFSTQADVWKRDITYAIKGALSPVGEALVYPYTYKYVFGGRAVYEIEIENDGRETGCKISIKNKNEVSISQLEWFIENTIIDYYGNEQTTVQRSKWFTTFTVEKPGTTPNEENVKTTVTLQKDYELYVDSNPVTQEAKVIRSDNTAESVVAWQEPSWEYINFIRIKHGKNRLVFYVEHPDVDITIEYQEQKEII